ncbi:hypothetical protein [Methylobacterium radiodurans]|uniref:Uncharacterized protein n=1 Tax=Methylobacterium radiodurans TaxID=2202828 RepID=A0A2U8VPD0_9HYPH|nr:hypothetical protein [Methylobacterium radiodurans]AWN35291.1 hypothetical protein DK427_05715 [Methylobacterium radiodurans]
MVRTLAATLVAALALGFPCVVRAQDAPAPEEAPAPKAARPKPAKPAPKPKAESKPKAEPAPVPQAPEPRAAEPLRAPAIDRAPLDATFAAPPTIACGAKAARFEGEKGGEVFVTRVGRAQVENPLRPLTPETTEVLQVAIGGKLATAYGPDLSALRRGGPPGAIEAQLGTAIRWQEGLPALPDPLTIVSEEGRPVARLGFRECTEAPAVKAPPPVAARKEPKPARPAKTREAAPKPAGEAPARGQARAAPKVPAGFSLPQGAITE